MTRVKPHITLFIGVLAVSFAAIFIRLADAPPLVIATYRLTISSIILIPVASLRCVKSLRQISKRDVLLVLLSSVFMALHFGLWITSLSYTSIASSVVLVTSHPAFVAVISYFLWGERLNKLTISGIAVALIGVIFINYGGFTFGSRAITGDLLALIAGFSMGAYLIIGGQLRARIGILSYLTIIYTCSAIMLLAASQAAMYALFRTCFTLYGVALNLATVGWIVIVLGILSMFVGVTMALRQTDIKRLIAYNCICESGFMLLGVGVGLAVLNNVGALDAYGRTAISGGIFHMINHALFEGLLFLVAGAIFYRIGTRNLNEMGGLGHVMKFTAVLFLLGALASSGIPPFNGFASKILIYESVYQFNPVLTIIGILVSIITLAVFMKVFFSAFTGQALPKYKEVREVPKVMIASMVILAAVIIFFGLFPGLIRTWLTDPAANALINQGIYINGIIP